MLTGKCKEAFENWYRENDNTFCLGYWKDTRPELLDKYDFLYELPFSMQYGVYLEFFDNVGILVKAFDYPMSKGDNFWWDIRLKEEEYNDWESGGYNTRQEAQIEAIKKANDIFNAR